jgi:hypothetical protein
MSTPEDRKPRQSRTTQICAVVFVLVGLTVFQSLASSPGPAPRGGGLDWDRVQSAGIVGGVCAAVGAGVGKLIERLRRREP